VTAATQTRTDEDIQRDILEELRWDATVQPDEIGVAVKDGVLSLFGRSLTISSCGCQVWPNAPVSTSL
jgi:osmotically-inducible protein OsmY